MGNGPMEITTESEGCIRVAHVDAHQKNSLPDSEGDCNGQADIHPRVLTQTGHECPTIGRERISE